MEIHSNPRESDRRNPLDFFSTLPLTRNGGGNFVVGASLFTELEKQAPGSRYFHVPVRTSRIDSLVSKIQRWVFRIPSHFVPYGPACLARMSDRVGEMLSDSCSAAFFKGITPWADWKPDRPYAAYTDVALATILENQGSRKHFSKRDVDRILGAERTFLEGAYADLGGGCLWLPLRQRCRFRHSQSGERRRKWTAFALPPNRQRTG
jgi:hypothetical protein